MDNPLVTIKYKPPTETKFVLRFHPRSKNCWSSPTDRQIRSQREADVPFKIQILLKRVEALLRRSGALAKELHYGGLSLQPENFKALHNGKELPMTLKEFDILMLIVQNKAKPYPMKQSSPAYGDNFDGDGSAVHTHNKTCVRNCQKMARAISRCLISPS